MKKITALLALSIILFACSSKKEGNMIVQGQIKGLKKGTLYLQKMQDTLLVSIDSVALLGKDTFTLTDHVDAPVLYYLTFDGNTTDKRILFFGEEGVITINDKVEQFGFAPVITGSKNQVVLDKYNVFSTIPSSVTSRNSSSSISYSFLSLIPLALVEITDKGCLH